MGTMLALTCNDNLVDPALADPAQQGAQVPAGHPVGDVQQLRGQQDDQPGQQGVNHDVAGAKGEEKRRLQRLHDLIGIHGAAVGHFVGAVDKDVAIRYAVVS